MRCLPVADDCGVSQGVTETILHCIDAQSLRGTSILAGGCYAQQAAAKLAERLCERSLEQISAPEPQPMPQRQSLYLGVHLNLLEGKAMAPVSALPLLVDERGNFRHTLASLWRLLTFSSARKKAALLEQAELEFSAQIDFVRAAMLVNERALPPLYLDGHLHVHIIPGLRPVLLSIADKYSVAHVRVPAEPRYILPASVNLQCTGTLRHELLVHWSRPLHAALRGRGVSTPDFFIGAFCSGSMTLQRLKAGIARVHRLAKHSDPVVEIMFHPGGFSEPERCTSLLAGATEKLPYTAFYRSPNRKIESDLLLSADFHQLMADYDSTWPAVCSATTDAPRSLKVESVV